MCVHEQCERASAFELTRLVYVWRAEENLVESFLSFTFIWILGLNRLTGFQSPLNPCFEFSGVY